MTAAPTVLVHRSPDELAGAVCARLITTLVDVQASGRIPSWVLTGGSIAERIYAAVAASSARDAVDWTQVELWWGDERFVATGDPDRNETQARAALLDSLRLDPARVHPMAPPEETDRDVDLAATLYAEALLAATQPDDPGEAPTFDVVMLGVGPDGHVASLFPQEQSLHEHTRTVVSVRAAPKPPPTRLTLTMPTLRNAREIWFVVTGEDKADAVRLALSGADMFDVPAAGPRGHQRTLWLLDRAAAAGLPPGLSHHTSP